MWNPFRTGGSGEPQYRPRVAQILCAGITCWIALSPSSGRAEFPDRSNHAALTYMLTEHGGDFGFGGAITSPYFLKQRLAVRAAGGMSLLSGIPPGGGRTQTFPYGHARAGIVIEVTRIGERIRLYNDHGIMMAFPNNAASHERMHLGFHGVIGAEFFLGSAVPGRFTYFFELGASWTGARADALQGQPLYSSGFLSGTGLRMYL